MIRIAMPWIIESCAAIERLKSVNENMSKFDIYVDLANAKDTLDNLFGASIYRPYLRVSTQTANDLADSLAPLIESLSTDWEKDLPMWKIANVRQKSETFSQILKSELGLIPSYLVLPKGSHDVALLTEQGEAVFPPETVNKVPSSQIDMQEAAKALAFELPTSCGFHTFRVLETVLRSYWDAVAGGADHPKVKSIGMYAEQLKVKGYGDEKICEVLKQIKDLHRNPLAHPEVILSTEEAIGIIGIARSAIGAMLRFIPDAQPLAPTPQPEFP